MPRFSKKALCASVLLSVVSRLFCSESILHGTLMSLSRSGDHLISTSVPFPSGTSTTSPIGSLNTSLDCPSCMDRTPFSAPYGGRYFEAVLTNNSLLVLQIGQNSETDSETVSSVRINASIPFDPSCRPRYLAKSAYNEENYYVVFEFCETWNPHRDRNGVISPPSNVMSGPSIVVIAFSGEDSDYIVTARQTVITITDDSESNRYNSDNSREIRPASDQCVEYTNLYPIHCPAASGDAYIDFLLECRTSDQSLKLFFEHLHTRRPSTPAEELIGVSGVPLTSDSSDFIAILDGSKLSFVNYNDLSQHSGRYTFPSHIETVYFYKIGTSIWLSVVIANENLFLVNVAEFVRTRGGSDSMFEIPNTNAGLCDPTSLPQRLVTPEHLMVAVQNAQGSYDYVVVNLNTSGTPSEVSRVERIDQRPSYLIQFQESMSPPPTDSPTTATAETVQPVTTQPLINEDTTATVEPPEDHFTHTTESPPSPPKRVHIIAPSTAGGVGLLLAVVVVIIIIIIVLRKNQNKNTRETVVTPISVSSITDSTSTSSISSSGSSGIVVVGISCTMPPLPPIQETGQTAVTHV